MDAGEGGGIEDLRMSAAREARMRLMLASSLRAFISASLCAHRDHRDRFRMYRALFRIYKAL